MTKLLTGVLAALLLLAPHPVRAQTITGIASWYSLPGNRTATGEVFYPNGMTCAKKIGGPLRLRSTVRVVRLVRVGSMYREAASALCRVNDTGPLAPGRIIDLSPAVRRAVGGGDLTLVRVYYSSR